MSKSWRHQPSKGYPRKRAVKRSRPASSQRPQQFVDWSRIRIGVVACLFGVLWLSLWARAYYVQIVEGPRLEKMVNRQHMASEYVAGERGQIFDRNGRLLAKSVAIKSVFVRPYQVPNPTEAAQKLSNILDLPRNDVLKNLTSREKHVWIARQVDDNAAARVREAKIKGVYLTTEYGRQYPNRELAGQLLGFVGLDDKGLEGIESYFDSQLAGRRAKLVVQRDAAGKKLYLDPSGREVMARGDNIQLTLDANIQLFAEEALARAVSKNNAKWGGALVIHTPTGEVRAWAEFPHFNPNSYKRYKPSRWRNRIAMDAFEPGSCIKPLLVAAALQEGICDPETVYFVENGRMRIGRKVIRDITKREFLPVRKIVRYSSNIGVAKIAMAMGESTLYDYFTRLGFGEKIGLPLPGESKGLLRPPGSWEEIEIATAGFGQGFSVSLAQVARAYLCLLNDGVLKPLRLVASPIQETQSEMRIFDQQVARQVLAMMSDVVQADGTGVRARIPGLTVGGKTSTAQKAGKGGYTSKVVASFFGFFPADQPEYLILVAVDEPEPEHYGGVVAAPAFKEIAMKILAYEGRLPDSPTQLAEKACKPVKKAKTRKISAQNAVTCALQDTKNVPDVRGLTLRRAVEVFAHRGVVPTIQGKGTVVSRQTPKPGRPWSDKHAVTIWLAPHETHS